MFGEAIVSSANGSKRVIPMRRGLSSEPCVYLCSITDLSGLGSDASYHKGFEKCR